MAPIETLLCCFCHTGHGQKDVVGLMAEGWFANGVSKHGFSAKRLICPDCLKRVYGRKLKPRDFVISAYYTPQLVIREVCDSLGRVKMGVPLCYVADYSLL